MPSVFVSHAYADRGIAARVISALQDEGLATNIEPDDAPGSSVIVDQQRALDKADVIVVLWSEAAAASAWVQREVQQAIQAWSEDRLVLARLDAAKLPPGLADLAVIELADNIDAGIRRIVGQAARSAGARKAQAAEPDRAPMPAPAARGGSGTWIATASIAVAAVAATGFVAWLLRSTGDGRGLAFLQPLLLGIGAVILAGLVWAVVRGMHSAGSAGDAGAPSSPPGSPERGAHTGHHVFVSYSRHDGRPVDELVRRIEQAGYKVWIDRSAGPHGGRYAAPIVAAIRQARVVALMCSKNAFASDHVVREVYVAGDFKKPFIAFQLDESEFPDDLLYFVTGFPRLPLSQARTDTVGMEIARFVAA